MECNNLRKGTLGIEIAQIEVSKERSMIYHPEYKGVRLDVYAKDEHNIRYNVEIFLQNIKQISHKS